MKSKLLGQVYTPKWIVNNILDFTWYKWEQILNKKIIEPSCWDGVFLTEIVDRLINQGKLKNMWNNEIKHLLEQNIYWIEIDKIEYEKCILKLNDLVNNLLQEHINIKWNIINWNTLLEYKKYIHTFDFVVWNPPYIRIHNLDEKTRKILKSEFIYSKGTIDIYLSFFELWFKLLKDNGKLWYITPNSYLHNRSYKAFRNFLKAERMVNTLVDFKSNKIFNKFSTYTAITIVDLSKKENDFEYFELIDNKLKKINTISYNIISDEDWSFSSKKNMEFLRKIYSSNSKRINDFFNIQYWIATLRDKIYIWEIKSEKWELVLFNKKIVKGSTYKWKKGEIKYIIFPYKKENNKFISYNENELLTQFPYVYNYLTENKKELLQRDMDKWIHWYEFGRSQWIQTSNKRKLVFSTLVKDKINYYYLPEDVFVYSGIFITQKDNCSWDKIKKTVETKDFLHFVKITWKNFSWWYTWLTSKMIKMFPLKDKDKNKK